MRFMTDKDRRILNRLVEIAGGSPLLVEQAFADVSRQATDSVKLEDVIRYILENRARWHREYGAQMEDAQQETAPA